MTEHTEAMFMRKNNVGVNVRRSNNKLFTMSGLED